jgi:hypothetical protein
MGERERDGDTLMVRYQKIHGLKDTGKSGVRITQKHTKSVPLAVFPTYGCIEKMPGWYLGRVDRLFWILHVTVG